MHVITKTKGKKMKVLKISALFSVLFLQGCVVSALSQSIVTESAIQKRTAQSFGVDPSSVVISNIDKELMNAAGRINYTAMVGKTKYSCYLTAMIGSLSDAMCTKAGQQAKNPLKK